MARPRTRRQAAKEWPSLLALPDECLLHILSTAAEGEPWARRRRLAGVCRAFRALFAEVAFAGRPLALNLNALSHQVHASRRKTAARRDLLAALAAVAPSVTHLQLRNRWEAPPGLALADLLQPLAPRCQLLEAEDCLDGRLLAALMGGWGALREVRFTGCAPWADAEPTGPHELRQLLATLPPRIRDAITTFEGSCQGMEAGEEDLFGLLPGLRSLELEDLLVQDEPVNYGVLQPHKLPHLTRLFLGGTEGVDAATVGELCKLTQVRELSLLGCSRVPAELTRLTSLVHLDFGGYDDEEDVEGKAAAWRCRALTELRFCGALDPVMWEGAGAEGAALAAHDAPAALAAHDAPAAPAAPTLDLPNLVALEFDEAYLTGEGGLPPLLFSRLTGLTSLRLTGGVYHELPPAISLLQRLQVFALDSLFPVPAIPPAISALQSVTNLQLSSCSIMPHVPLWVLDLPVQKLHVAHNRLTSLLPEKGARVARLSSTQYRKRVEAFCGRLTHVCLSGNALAGPPRELLEHGCRLRELDCSYNRDLQVDAKAADALAQLSGLELLRLDKSFWLQRTQRWTPASLRALERLQQRRPNLAVEGLEQRFVW